MVGLRVVAVLLAAVAVSVAGCNSGGAGPATPPANGGTTNGGSGGSTTNGGTTEPVSTNGEGQTAAVVKTHIVLDSAVRVVASDDLIVFGTAVPNGVDYVIPSATDDTATAGVGDIPFPERYGSRTFVVAGRKIVLVNPSNQLEVFDTTAKTLATVPGSQVTLAPLPVAADGAGHMQADGSLVAMINDTSAVTDGNAIKVLDVSGDDPVVISFPTPADFLGMFDQVAIDAETREVVAYGSNPGSVIYLFNIDDPNGAPGVYDLFERGYLQQGVQMAYEDHLVLYTNGEDQDVTLLDTTTDNITVMTNNPANLNGPLALRGGSLTYFQDASSEDSVFGAGRVWRSAIGPTADAPDSTLAVVTDYVDATGDTPSAFGILGYGATTAITPDGQYWLLAGDAYPDDDIDYLQISTGGKFAILDDPEGTSRHGRLIGANVSASADTIAFMSRRQISEDDDTLFEIDDVVLSFVRVEDLPELLEP